MSDEHHIQHVHEFYIVSDKNERICGCDIQDKDGVKWLSNFWTHADFRRKGLGAKVFRFAVSIYGPHYDLYLQVAPYTNQPVSPEKLTAWYGTFGFVSTEVPGVLRRKAGPL